MNERGPFLLLRLSRSRFSGIELAYLWDMRCLLRVFCFYVFIFSTGQVVLTKQSYAINSCQQLFSQEKLLSFEEKIESLGLRVLNDGELILFRGVPLRTEKVALFLQRAKQQMPGLIFIADRGSRLEEISTLDFRHVRIPERLLSSPEELYKSLEMFLKNYRDLKRLYELKLELERVILSSHTLEFDIVKIGDPKVAPGLEWVQNRMKRYNLTLSFREKLKTETVDSVLEPEKTRILGLSYESHVFLLSETLFRYQSSFLDNEGLRILVHEMIHSSIFQQHLKYGRALLWFYPLDESKHPFFPDAYKNGFRSDEFEAWQINYPSRKYEQFLVQKDWIEAIYKRMEEKKLSFSYENDVYPPITEYHKNVHQMVDVNEEGVGVTIYLPRKFSSNAELNEYIQDALKKRLIYLKLNSRRIVQGPVHPD